jgi:release factor glutamine methyltransferase
MAEVAMQSAALAAGPTLRDAFAATARALRQQGIATPELDARLLVCHAAGIGREAYMTAPLSALTRAASSRLATYVRRRLQGEPVSRILGFREFFGRRFVLDANVLDPRADTETLVEAALGVVDRNGWRGRSCELLDLGTGSGAILVTLLAELPLARGVGTDASAAALSVARANARRLKVDDRARFVAADWLDPIVGTFDLIVANPPYIEAAELAGLPREVQHDPRIALDGGADGLQAYRRIAGRAGQILRPGGMVLLEIGAGQANAVLGLLREAGLEAGNWVWSDLAGHPRCVGAGF